MMKLCFLYSLFNLEGFSELPATECLEKQEVGSIRINYRGQNSMRVNLPLESNKDHQKQQILFAIILKPAQLNYLTALMPPCYSFQRLTSIRMKEQVAAKRLRSAGERLQPQGNDKSLPSRPTHDYRSDPQMGNVNGRILKAGYLTASRNDLRSSQGRSIDLGTCLKLLQESLVLLGSNKDAKKRFEKHIRKVILNIKNESYPSYDPFARDISQLIGRFSGSRAGNQLKRIASLLKSQLSSLGSYCDDKQQQLCAHDKEDRQFNNNKKAKQGRNNKESLPISHAQKEIYSSINEQDKLLNKYIEERTSKYMHFLGVSVKQIKLKFPTSKIQIIRQKKERKRDNISSKIQKGLQPKGKIGLKLPGDLPIVKEQQRESEYLQTSQEVNTTKSRERIALYQQENIIRASQSFEKHSQPIIHLQWKDSQQFLKQINQQKGIVQDPAGKDSANSSTYPSYLSEGSH